MSEILDKYDTVEQRFDSLEWKTPRTVIPETVQHTDDYVVHARGYVVGNDIWYDEYAVHVGHNSMWSNHIAPHYDLPEYTGSWIEYRKEHFSDDDPIPLYFSVTGAESFILQHPRLEWLGEEGLHRLYLLLEEMEVPRDYNLTIHREPPDSNGSHAQSILRALSADVDKNFSIPVKEFKSEVSELMER